MGIAENKNQIKKYIFIGGCPRSGTTLLGAHLGSHQRAICLPESNFKTDIARIIGCGTVKYAELCRFLDDHVTFRSWKVQIPRNHNDEDIDTIKFREIFEWLVVEYAKMNGAGDYEFVIDHTPDNIGNIKMLMRMFPNSAFIHIVRDGRAVANSIKKLDWGPNVMETIAKYWMNQVALGLATEVFYPRIVKRIHFEEFVNKAEDTLKILSQYLEMTWDPRLLLGDGFEVPKWTQKQHELIGKGINRNSMEKWERELKANEIEIFEHFAGNMLDILGYNLRFKYKTRGPSLVTKFRYKLEDLVKTHVVNQWKFRSRMNIPVFRTRKRYRQL